MIVGEYIDILNFYVEQINKEKRKEKVLIEVKHVHEKTRLKILRK